MWGGVTVDSIANFLKIFEFDFKSCGVFKDSTYR